jgi:hypothetical protein
MITLISKVKLIAAVLIAIGMFIAGAKFASTNTVETVTKEVKGETITVVKERIVTVTKIVRPDGTVEETTKTEEKDKTKDKKETTKGGDVIVYKKPKYSVGYILRPKWSSEEKSILSKPTISHGVTAGYNLTNDIWLKFGTIPSDKIYTLGLELQF